MTTTTDTAGFLPLPNGQRFCWMLSGLKTPEVYGYIEDADRRAIPGTSGWYRTADPVRAANLAIDAVTYRASKA